MSGVEIAIWQTLDVLGTWIRSDLRWNDQVFNISKEAAKYLEFLKRCKKHFIPAELRFIYVTYIIPKMEYNSHLWAAASKTALDFVDRIQSQALKLIGDDRVVSSITFLGHRRNVICIVLFYTYYFGKFSSRLPEFIPPPQVFRRNTRLSGQSHAFTVAIMSHRTIGKIHSLPVQPDCGTTHPQISFLNASIFQCLKQE